MEGKRYGTGHASIVPYQVNIETDALEPYYLLFC